MNLNVKAGRAVLLAVLLAAAGVPQAWADGGAQMSLLEHAVVSSPAFLKAHPDLRFRQLGMEAVERNRPEDARRYFQLGAQHADKLSQALMAELLWNGKGGPTDRALGYAWMDLAAERGTQWLVVRREQYWAALGDSERKRAVSEGRTLYEEMATRSPSFARSASCAATWAR